MPQNEENRRVSPVALVKDPDLGRPLILKHKDYEVYSNEPFKIGVQFAVLDDLAKYAKDFMTRELAMFMVSRKSVQLTPDTKYYVSYSEFLFKQSPELTAFTEHGQNQLGMLRLIKEHGDCIVALDGDDCDPEDILRLVSQFQKLSYVKKFSYNGAVNDDSPYEKISISIEDETCPGNEYLPGVWVIEVPIYKGFSAYRIKLELKLSTDENKPVFTFRWLLKEKLLNQVVKDVYDQLVKDMPDWKVYRGV